MKLVSHHGFCWNVWEEKYLILFRRDTFLIECGGGSTTGPYLVSVGSLSDLTVSHICILPCVPVLLLLFFLKHGPGLLACVKMLIVTHRCTENELKKTKQYEHIRRNRVSVKNSFWEMIVTSADPAEKERTTLSPQHGQPWTGRMGLRVNKRPWSDDPRCQSSEIYKRARSCGVWCLIVYRNHSFTSWEAKKKNVGAMWNLWLVSVMCKVTAYCW